MNLPGPPAARQETTTPSRPTTVTGPDSDAAKFGSSLWSSEYAAGGAGARVAACIDAGLAVVLVVFVGVVVWQWRMEKGRLVTGGKKKKNKGRIMMMMMPGRMVVTGGARGGGTGLDCGGGGGPGRPCPAAAAAAGGVEGDSEKMKEEVVGSGVRVVEGGSFDPREGKR